MDRAGILSEVGVDCTESQVNALLPLVVVNAKTTSGSFAALTAVNAGSDGDAVDVHNLYFITAMMVVL